MSHRDLDSRLITSSPSVLLSSLLNSTATSATHPALRTTHSSSFASNSLVDSLEETDSDCQPLTHDKQTNTGLLPDERLSVLVSSSGPSSISSCRESLQSLGRGVSPSLQLVYGGFMITLLASEKREKVRQSVQQRDEGEKGALRAADKTRVLGEGRGVQLFYSFSRSDH